MLPFVPSFPFHSQIQTSGSNGSALQQVMLSDPCLANSTNSGSNHILQSPCCSCACHNHLAFANTSHVHPHIHGPNSQFPVTLNNRNTHISNLAEDAMAMPNGPHMTPSPSFLNAPNHRLPVQNNHGGMPFLNSSTPHHLTQSLGQFSSQNTRQTLNNVAASPVRGPFSNLPQGQFFVQNNPQMMTQIRPLQPHLCMNMPDGQFYSNNVPQHLNRSTGLSHGQFYLQNPMQNVNQFVPMEYSQHPVGPTQVAPNNTPPCSHPSLGCTSQGTQTLGTRNPTLLMNQQLDVVNPNEILQNNNQDWHLSNLPSMGKNALQEFPVAAQQLQGNLVSSNTCGPVQMQWKNLQPSGFQELQGNHAKDGGNNISNSNQRNPQSKTATGNHHQFGKREVNNAKDGGNNILNAHQRYPQSKTAIGNHQDSGKKLANPRLDKFQFHPKENANGNFRPFNRKQRKGNRNEGARKSHLANFTNQDKMECQRSLSWNYSEQEVKQWREARRKNHPSKTDMEKNLTEKHTNSDVIDRDAQTRRQELREILAKQAELGVEVAEIPQNYLSEVEDHVSAMEEGKCVWTKKDRFQNNKRGKRGKHGRESRFAKKQKIGDKDSSIMPALNYRKPSLLEKLMTADIKRDKSQLLQVFRFMVMNSFFKDWPEKHVEFPKITVKDTKSDVKVKPFLYQRNDGVSGVGENAMGEEVEGPKDCRGGGGGGNHNEVVAVYNGIVKSEVEDGEITD